MSRVEERGDLGIRGWHLPPPTLSPGRHGRTLTTSFWDPGSHPGAQGPSPNSIQYRVHARVPGPVHLDSAHLHHTCAHSCQ